MFTLDWSFLSKKVVGNQTYLGWLMTAELEKVMSWN